VIWSRYHAICKSLSTFYTYLFSHSVGECYGDSLQEWKDYTLSSFSTVFKKDACEDELRQVLQQFQSLIDAIYALRQNDTLMASSLSATRREWIYVMEKEFQIKQLMLLDLIQCCRSGEMVTDMEYAAYQAIYKMHPFL
jgi:hypothetical protein